MHHQTETVRTYEMRHGVYAYAGEIEVDVPRLRRFGSGFTGCVSGGTGRRFYHDSTTSGQSFVTDEQGRSDLIAARDRWLAHERKD